MKNVSELLKNTWWIIFRGSKTFWTLFFLTNGVGISIMLILNIFGYNVSTPFDFQYIQERPEDLTLYAISIVVGGILWGFFSFIWTLYLANMFTEKKVSLWAIFSQWEKIFPCIWTAFCIFLWYLWILIVLGIVWVMLFGIGHLGHDFIIWLRSELVFPAYFIGGIIFFLMVVSVAWLFIWLSLPLFTFPFPAFFLDNIKYFDAPMEYFMKILVRMNHYHDCTYRSFDCPRNFFLFCKYLYINSYTVIDTSMCRRCQWFSRNIFYSIYVFSLYWLQR